MNRSIRSGSLIVIGILSLVVFGWAIYKNLAIGIHASDTNTSGAGDQMAWVWLFVSFVMIVVVVVGLIYLSNRRSRERTGE